MIIVLSIAFSAAYILWESFIRLLHPRPMQHIPWVVAAAIIGFLGNEAVALLQIRAGRRMGSEAMAADGLHARIDGLTSLAVLIAAAGTVLGFPLVDSIIGLVMGVSVIFITKDAAVRVWQRLMDGVDPMIVDRIEQYAGDVRGVEKVEGIHGSAFPSGGTDNAGAFAALPPSRGRAGGANARRPHVRARALHRHLTLAPSPGRLRPPHVIGGADQLSRPKVPRLAPRPLSGDDRSEGLRGRGMGRGEGDRARAPPSVAARSHAGRCPRLRPPREAALPDMRRPPSPRAARLSLARIPRRVHRRIAATVGGPLTPSASAPILGSHPRGEGAGIGYLCRACPYRYE